MRVQGHVAPNGGQIGEFTRRGIHDGGSIPPIEVIAITGSQRDGEFGGKERLANLVCNVSNLQLRALRWYFNDQRFKGTDFYDGEKLKSVLVSAYRYFHPDDDRRQDMKDVISEYSGSGSIIDTMSTLDPRKSIPPYEDQNNRRPPADATLLLNPAVLNTKAPEWMDWAGKISEKYPVYAYETDFIARKEDRVSRINAKHGKLSDNFYQASYILQRIFDRNTKTDPFRLRENTEIYADSGLKSFDENNIGFKELSLVLGGNSSAVEFLKLAFDYYEETSAAKDGCWQAEFNMNSAKIPLLEKSGAHPPMKKSVLDILIGNILGADREIGRAFISSHVMDEPVEKRLKVKSICGKAADLLKKYGNGFKYSLEQAQEKNQQSKATADEIRQRIAGVYAMASKADDIAPAPGKYDDLWYDSNGNKLESYSIFGMTAGGLIEAIQTHDTEHINNEARSVIYYVVKEATGRNMETVKQAVKYAKHISKRTIGAENREAVLRCAQYAVGDDPSDELFDSAANMVRHLNDIIERISKRKMRRHNPVLREIFGSLDFFKPVMDTVVFCIELILYGVSCGGFCFMLIYGIGTVVTLIERSGTAELLGVLRLFGISAAVCVGCLAAAVFIGWIWDTYFDGGLSRD